MAAIRRKAYVLRNDALEILAGNDPDLRTRAGKPNASAISTAAGLDSTTLLQIINSQIGLSIWVKAALVDFLMCRGFTRAGAESALFDLVDTGAGAPRPRKKVPGRAQTAVSV